jgi:hypothetical protein
MDDEDVYVYQPAVQHAVGPYWPATTWKGSEGWDKSSTIFYERKYLLPLAQVASIDFHNQNDFRKVSTLPAPTYILQQRICFSKYNVSFPLQYVTGIQEGMGFVAIFYGSLEVQNEGTYTFCLDSHDG